MSSSFGRRMRFEISAAAMTSIVNKPKYIVGTRLESVRMEKPMMIVIEV